MKLHQQLLSKDATMSVVGLGYVGLPIALAFAKHLKVIGFDIHEGRVKMMRNGQDPSEEVPAKGFANRDISFTSDAADLKRPAFTLWLFPHPSMPTTTQTSDLSWQLPGQWGEP